VIKAFLLQNKRSSSLAEQVELARPAESTDLLPELILALHKPFPEMREFLDDL